MRHLSTALLIPVFTCAVAVNQARAIEIALAGDECASPDLLGLSLVVGGPAGQTIVGCDTAEFNGLAGGFGGISDGTTPFYGEFIDSIELQIVGLAPDDEVTASDSSLNELDLIQDLGDGRFRLFSDGSGLDVCSLDLCLEDGVLFFSDLPGDRELTITVVAVNDLAVPEPATLVLTALGLAGLATRRSNARGRLLRDRLILRVRPQRP
jgi:hypothetical protein